MNLKIQNGESNMTFKNLKFVIILLTVTIKGFSGSMIKVRIWKFKISDAIRFNSWILKLKIAELLWQMKKQEIYINLINRY